MREQQQVIDEQQQELLSKGATITQLETRAHALVQEQQQVCATQKPHCQHKLDAQGLAAVEVLREEHAALTTQLNASIRELDRLKAADKARGKQLRAMERQVLMQTSAAATPMSPGTPAGRVGAGGGCSASARRGAAAAAGPC